nr:agamous-like MADS-box protein AGL8 homolog [Ipomoea batatas]
MEAVEVETFGDAPVIDPKKARLARWESQLAQLLTRGTISLPEMFNLLFQLSPPAASLVNETIDYVGAQFAHHLSQVLALAASTGTELFDRARLDAMEHEGELRKLKEKDAAAHYASRPVDLPILLSTLCPSKDAALPLFYTLPQDPVGLMMLRRVTAWGYHRGKHVMQKSLYQTLEDVLPEDWEQVRAVLPAEILPPGPELFSDPPTAWKEYSASISNDAFVMRSSLANLNWLIQLITDITCMERILARYERCSYAESLANSTANPTDQESLGSWSLEYAKLKARIEFLEKSKRHYMGEDIDSLSLKELQNLEHQIDSSMKHIRSRKDRALKDENNKLAKKIKEREKEMAEQPNLEQQEKQDTNSSSSYVPSQPINSFNLGETYEAAGEDREIEDAPAAQPPPPPNIVMPQWLLPHLTGG